MAKVKRVVMHKGYWLRNDETGKTDFVEAGKVVEVDPETAEAHKDRLKDPRVVQAEAAATQAQLDALNASEEETEEAQPPKGAKPQAAKPAAAKT